MGRILYQIQLVLISVSLFNVVRCTKEQNKSISNEQSVVFNLKIEMNIDIFVYD